MLKLSSHTKYLSIILTTVVILCSGCGEPDLIVTDSVTEDDDQSIVIDEVSETGVQAEDDTGKGVGGWWGVRHVKDIFTSEEDETYLNDPDNDANIPFSEVADESLNDPDAVWTAEDEVISDAEYQEATELVKTQNFQEAKNILLDIIQRHPDSSSAWRWLGDCYYNLLQLPEAIDAYQRARTIYPENYFAMRGEGFAHLHYGNELWQRGERRNAHDQYRKALRTLQNCMRIYPGDLEALYGRSMAAEGASRRLYQNAITLLRQGKREPAESEAKICVEVIDEGIESSRQRLLKKENELGPIIITGGLFQRRAILLKAFERYEVAAEDMAKAIEAYEAVLNISPNNPLAEAELEKCLEYQKQLDELIANMPVAF